MENLREISCEVCFEIYDVFRLPNILPCGHIMCYSCLSSLPELPQKSLSYSQSYRPIELRRVCSICKKCFNKSAMPINYAALSAAYSYWEKKQAAATALVGHSPGAAAPQALGYDASRRKTYDLPQLIASLDQPAPRLTPYPPPTRKVIVHIFRFDTTRQAYHIICGSCGERFTNQGSDPGIFVHCRSCRVQNVLLPRFGWFVRFCTGCQDMIFIHKDKPEPKCASCCVEFSPPPPETDYQRIIVIVLVIIGIVLQILHAWRGPNPK